MPNGGEISSRIRSDRADHRPAVMDSDPHCEGPLFALNLSSNRDDQFAGATEHSLRRIFATKENGHHGVADKFIHIPAGGNDRIRLESEEPVQFAHEMGGFARFALARETTQVREKHNDFLFHAGQPLRVFATPSYRLRGKTRDIRQEGELFA